MKKYLFLTVIASITIYSQSFAQSGKVKGPLGKSLIGWTNPQPAKKVDNNHLYLPKGLYGKRYISQLELEKVTQVTNYYLSLAKKALARKGYQWTLPVQQYSGLTKRVTRPKGSLSKSFYRWMSQ